MWIKIIGGELPPEGKPIKIKTPEQREQELIRKGYKFYLPDLTKFVSFTPTHWWKD